AVTVDSTVTVTADSQHDDASDDATATAVTPPESETVNAESATVSGKRRPLIPVPFPTRWISVWFLNVITSVPPTTAKALIQGLR
ncbi:hypothetical protein ONO57_26010, partial [Salmonella enterica subsp. enterica serovar Anatum]|nr:hypothetical protein [Salmonella enterica subsp. enterica serovar Anatum]